MPTEGSQEKNFLNILFTYLTTKICFPRSEIIPLEYLKPQYRHV